MKEVKVLPKFKCDFCKKRSTKARMLIHEKRCFQNPNRFCDYCKNTGKHEESMGDDNDTRMDVDCIYCSKFNPETFKEIKEWKAQKNPPKEIINNEEIPF